MYLTRTPEILKPLYRDLTWSIPTAGRVVHITFDDGPVPQTTPWVLDTLARHGAKATFFCIGRNIALHPDLFARIRMEGHGVGNHTWDHRNGWRTSTFAYLRSVLLCQMLTGTCLFRPPYGRISRDQVHALCGRFRIVMWDVLSADFDTRIDGYRCIRNVLDNVRGGSIVVFHDSIKAAPRMRRALPVVLDRLAGDGYRFEVLPGGTTGMSASRQACMPPTRS
ncbi:MAG: polysaccharide deacetylase family protein [Flavobacteriales bacterium]|nr:polysaccharide deacetylase family protein [Flavobacteriales bacterium]MCB9193275.1 polysaccharide deacetylase family protein [Flavobacteriales bacterium]